MESHRKADHEYYLTAEKVLSLASRASELYESSKPTEKRELLSYLLSNCQLDGRKLRYTANKPFDTILKYAPRSAWLPLLHAFRTQIIISIDLTGIDKMLSNTTSALEKIASQTPRNTNHV